MAFTPKDDRVSPDEAPVFGTPKLVDIYGTAWQDRPDSRVRTAVQKLPLSEKEYWTVERHITMRTWPDLREHLATLSHRFEGDDQLRAQQAIAEVDKVTMQEKELNEP